MQIAAGAFYENQTLDPLIDSGEMIVLLPCGARVEILDGDAAYVLTGHLQSAGVTLRPDNTVSGQIESTPFGERKKTEDAQIVSSFTGKVFEPEIGT